jgi:hypothetical protein
MRITQEAEERFGVFRIGKPVPETKPDAEKPMPSPFSR